MSYFVYLLLSSSQSTYVGATIDLDRRLRQHNKEIKGGAVATSIKVQKGEQWTRICHVAGFPSWNAALQFEWRWKQLSRKEKGGIALHRRLRALRTLLSLEKPTESAIPYDAYPDGPPTIQWECPNAEAWFGGLKGQLTGQPAIDLILSYP